MCKELPLWNGSALESFILIHRREGDVSKSATMLATPRLIAGEKLARFGMVMSTEQRKLQKP